ncbi:uncharacterized protein LOC122250510 [Penaeus japonicus]|uniref:uncharacterized protein LOC122250510 n=1 Tax=Penaeus japonicus TaxID=27405 RepID=UPI001C715726|nr:uncharacterized protein LOC122250510 [Penaeus japonicus]
MKIARKLLPLKAHYFFFLGCMSPVLPFLMVVALQLGIPVSVQGTIYATSLLLTVVGKPVIAALADCFPNYRKGIFLVVITVMVTSYSCVRFIPPMRDPPVLRGRLVLAPAGSSSSLSSSSSSSSSPSPSPSGSSSASPSGASGRQEVGEEAKPMFLAQGDGGCFIAMSWDCIATCNQPFACLNSNMTSGGDLKATQVPVDLSDIAEEGGEALTEGGHPPDGSWVLGAPNARLYRLEGADVPPLDLVGMNVTLECLGGEWKGDDCVSAWSYGEFWLYFLLLIVGQLCFNTANSITDAIAVDSVGEGGAFGVQRAWGTVGWGLMGPISGYLIDWWSGTALTKDYTPAFLLVFLLGSVDVFLSAATLKVPEMKSDNAMLKNLRPLLSDVRFFIFCCFVIMNGCFDGVVANFIFMMQEDMSRGTSAMSYMKFLQGFTLFVQCAIEAPFMFVYSWFLRKMGAQQVTSLVFFLYIFRLLGLSVVGAYGPAWATLLVEFLNGPCYGLGYTAIVVYAAKISPPGTSNTVQSVVNICYESFGYASASLVGGVLYQNFGGPKMYLMFGSLSVLVFLLHVLSLKFLPPPEVPTNGEVTRAAAGDALDVEEKVALSLESPTESNHRGSVDTQQEQEQREEGVREAGEAVELKVRCQVVSGGVTSVSIMKINKSLLPIKGHYFIFWGSYASALPFMMVVARQLGIPVALQGTITAAIIAAAVLAKPVISAAADHLPSLRKSIFLGLLTIMVTTLGPIGFLKPLYPAPVFQGALGSAAAASAGAAGNGSAVLRARDTGTCYVSSAWDCDITCYPGEPCPQAISQAGFTLSSFHRRTQEQEVDNGTSTHRQNDRREYSTSGLHFPATDEAVNVSIRCKAGEWQGHGCHAPWETAEFWLFVTLLLAGQVAASTVESISDAVCLDIIGENGDYGGQRAWGALSYGIVGTLSGILVDWYSGPGVMKDYMPAFLLLVLLGTFDVLLSSATLKIPKFESKSAIWGNLRPVLRQPAFFIFLCFAFLIGFFDGLDTGYVFVLQEDIGAGTSLVQHMKFIQGLTLLVQAISAAPFMFVYARVESKLGSGHIITLVFLLFSLRLAGLAAAGFLGQVWATVAMEVINGPCFGLGYSAIIVQAGAITPPGTSATVQSLVGICYGTLGYAGASFVGGVLYDAVGGPLLYLCMGGAAAVTCLLHFIYNKYMPQAIDKTEELSLETVQGKEVIYSVEREQLREKEEKGEEEKEEIASDDKEIGEAEAMIRKEAGREDLDKKELYDGRERHQEDNER